MSVKGRMTKQKRAAITMKRVVAIIMLLAMVLSITIAGFSQGYEKTNKPELDRLINKTNILEKEEEIAIEKEIRRLIDKHNQDILIIIAENYSYFGDEEIFPFLEKFFIGNGYGVGEQNSGIALMLSMADRKYAIVIRGETKEYIDDYRYKKMLEPILAELKSNNFKEGITAFQNEVDKYMTSGKAPIRMYPMSIRLIASLVIALIFIVVNILLLSNKKAKTEAGDYLIEGSFKLNSGREDFVRKTIHKTARAKSSSGGSGGGGSSGGGSGSF